MTIPTPIRIDKFLWATRLFKTRSLATEACKSGKIMIEDIKVKPSRIMTGNETIKMRQRGIWRTFLVLKLIDKRIGAKIVPEVIEEKTPPEELEKLKMISSVNPVFRSKGLGRPTKKDRRKIDNWKDDSQ